MHTQRSSGPPVILAALALGVALLAGCVHRDAVRFTGRPANTDPEPLDGNLERALAPLWGGPEAEPLLLWRSGPEGLLALASELLPAEGRAALTRAATGPGDAAQRREAVEAALMAQLCPAGQAPPRSPWVAPRAWLRRFDERLARQLGASKLQFESELPFGPGDGSLAAPRSLLRAQQLWRFCLREPSVAWERLMHAPMLDAEAYHDWVEDTGKSVRPWAADDWLEEAERAERAWLGQRYKLAAWQVDERLSEILARQIGVRVPIEDAAGRILARLEALQALGQRFRALAASEGDPRPLAGEVTPLSADWQRLLTALERETPRGAFGPETPAFVLYLPEARRRPLLQAWARRPGEPAAGWRDRIEADIEQRYCDRSPAGIRLPPAVRLPLLERLAAHLETPHALPLAAEARALALRAQIRGYLVWGDCLRPAPLTPEAAEWTPTRAEDLEQRLAALQTAALPLKRLEDSLPDEATLTRLVSEAARRLHDALPYSQRGDATRFAAAADGRIRATIARLGGPALAAGAPREMAGLLAVQSVLPPSPCPDGTRGALAGLRALTLDAAGRPRWLRPPGEDPGGPALSEATLTCLRAIAADLSQDGPTLASRLLDQLVFLATWDGVVEYSFGVRYSKEGVIAHSAVPALTCRRGAIRTLKPVPVAARTRPHLTLVEDKRQATYIPIYKEKLESVLVGWDEVRTGGPTTPPPPLSQSVEALRAEAAALERGTRGMGGRQAAMDAAAREEAQANRGVDRRYRSWQSSAAAGAYFQSSHDDLRRLGRIQDELAAYEDWAYRSQVKVQRVPRFKDQRVRVKVGDATDMDAEIHAVRRFGDAVATGQAPLQFRSRQSPSPLQTESWGTLERNNYEGGLNDTACVLADRLATPAQLLTDALRAPGGGGTPAPIYAAAEAAAARFTAGLDPAQVEAFFAALAAAPPR